MIDLNEERKNEAKQGIHRHSVSSIMTNSEKKLETSKKKVRISSNISWD